MNCELPDVQAGFRKDIGTRDQIPNSPWMIKKPREFEKIIYFWFIDYTTKDFECVDHSTLRKILQEMEIPGHLSCLLRNLCACQKQQLELGMKQQTGSKSEKEYIEAVYCHPAYLTYMQSTSCEMPG